MNFFELAQDIHLNGSILKDEYEKINFFSGSLVPYYRLNFVNFEEKLLIFFLKILKKKKNSILAIK